MSPDGLASRIVLLIAVPTLFFVITREPFNMVVVNIIILAPVAMVVHYVLKHAFRALW
jgi:hypothetical protein